MTTIATLFGTMLLSALLAGLIAYIKNRCVDYWGFFCFAFPPLLLILLLLPKSTKKRRRKITKYDLDEDLQEWLDIKEEEEVTLIVKFKNKISITKLSLPPGTTILRISRFIYTQKTFNRIFEPTIADMREEYFEAIQNEEKLKAKWINIRGHLIFVQTMIAHAGVSVVKLAKNIWTIAG